MAQIVMLGGVVLGSAVILAAFVPIIIAAIAH